MAHTATARPNEDEETMVEKDLPEPVKSDYTQKPQKPITLKPGIADERLNAVSWTRPPGEILGDSSEQQSAAPAAEEEPPIPTTVEWTLHDISAETRDEAIECAKLEGVPVGEWVDRILRDVLFEPIPEESPDEEDEEPYEEYEETYDEQSGEHYEYPSAVASAEEMAPVEAAEPDIVELARQTPAQTTAEPSVPSPDLQVVLQEISNRLSALEQRRGFWDVVRGLFEGR